MINWISIKQVLPSYGQKVLVWDGDFSIVTFNKDGGFGTKVTHWAQLDTPEQCAQERIKELQREQDALLRRMESDKFFKDNLLPNFGIGYINKKE